MKQIFNTELLCWGWRPPGSQAPSSELSVTVLHHCRRVPSAAWEEPSWGSPAPHVEYGVGSPLWCRTWDVPEPREANTWSQAHLYVFLKLCKALRRKGIY